MNTPYQSQQPVTDFGLGFAREMHSATIAADTSTPFTVPPGSKRYKAIIQMGAVGAGWMALNKVAALPAGAAFAKNDSEMIQSGNVYAREVVPGDVIQFFHEGTEAAISIILYSV